MNVRSARRLVVCYLVAYTILLTFPGVVPFNAIQPMVLGMPFNFFWLLLWIVLTPLCMWAAYRVEASRSSEASPRRQNENPSR